MLTDPQLARNLKVALFEEVLIESLEIAVQEWLDSQDEAFVVGISFEADAGATSFRAHILYTE